MAAERRRLWPAMTNISSLVVGSPAARYVYVVNARSVVIAAIIVARKNAAGMFSVDS